MGMKPKTPARWTPSASASARVFDTNAPTVERILDALNHLAIGVIVTAAIGLALHTSSRPVRSRVRRLWYASMLFIEGSSARFTRAQQQQFSTPERRKLLVTRRQWRDSSPSAR